MFLLSSMALGRLMAGGFGLLYYNCQSVVMLAFAWLQLQTHPGPRRLHLLDQDGVVRNAHWFLIRLEEMLFHHIMKEGVTASQDGSWDTGVHVQPSTREELTQRSPSCQEEFSAVVFISDKGTYQTMWQNHSEYSQELLRQTSQQHPCWAWGSSPWLQEHIGDQPVLWRIRHFLTAFKYILDAFVKVFSFSQDHDISP